MRHIFSGFIGLIVGIVLTSWFYIVTTPLRVLKAPVPIEIVQPPIVSSLPPLPVKSPIKRKKRPTTRRKRVMPPVPVKRDDRNLIERTFDRLLHLE